MVEDPGAPDVALTVHAEVDLVGGGTILREVEAAAEILEADYKVAANVWSLTSANELQREGKSVERWNLMHPESEPRVPYVTECLGETKGPVIAATDYVRPYPPNAWVQEDVESLERLNGESAIVRRPSVELRQRDDFLHAVGDVLTRLDDAGDGALIVFVSAHGAVDPENQLCLIPPGAAPLAPPTLMLYVPRGTSDVTSKVARHT